MSTVAPTTAASSLLNTLSATPASTTVGAQANDPQMNEFLQLLTAQLQNQDPTSPTDPTQFVSQLAQFSTVEQLVQSNTKLDTISQTLSGLALGQYSGLINHTVSASTTSITVPTSGSQSQMAFNVTAANLSGVHVQIADASGNPVRSIPVTGSTGAVAFDGLSDSGQPLPAGQYRRFVGRHDEPGHVTVGRHFDHHRHCVWRVAGFERWLAASVQRRPHGRCVNSQHGVVISRTAVS